jgi:diguanylate cyclase (GGDEF)-like protein/PAS domain S-box-containing protein
VSEPPSPAEAPSLGPPPGAGELLERVEGLRYLLEQAPTGLVVAEAPEGRIIVFNEEATRILGHPLIPAACGSEGMILEHVEAEGARFEPAEHPLVRALGGHTVRDQLVGHRRGDGSELRLSMSASPVRARSGSILGAIATFVDVTERYALEARVRARLERLVEERAQAAHDRARELDRLHADLRAISDGIEERVRQRTAELANHAQYDALTGLPNRILFDERLEREAASAERYARRLALLTLDLDDFRLLNDTFGREVGDRILREVAQRFRAGLRRSDTLARLGGDEFAVLVSEIKHPDDAKEVALALLSALVEPFDVPGNRVLMAASIGVCLYPDGAGDAAQLARRAEAAMVAVKESGGNGVRLHGSSERFALDDTDLYG